MEPASVRRYEKLYKDAGDRADRFSATANSAETDSPQAPYDHATASQFHAQARVYATTKAQFEKHTAAIAHHEQFAAKRDELGRFTT